MRGQRPAMTRMNTEPATKRTWATTQTIDPNKGAPDQRKNGLFDAGACPRSTCPTNGVFRSWRCRVIVRRPDLGICGAARQRRRSCGFRRRPPGRTGRATGSPFAPCVGRRRRADSGRLRRPRVRVPWMSQGLKTAASSARWQNREWLTKRGRSAPRKSDALRPRVTLDRGTDRGRISPGSRLAILRSAVARCWIRIRRQTRRRTPVRLLGRCTTLRDRR